jgi:transcriptional enhancer factor
LSEWGNERSPVKVGSHVENIEQKLGVWIEENGVGEEKGGYEEVNDAKGGYEVIGSSKNKYPEVGGLDHRIGSGLGDGGDEEKAHMHEWEVVDDGFDYATLAERLKA